MGDLKLSDDGLYYWDGQKWVSTLSPDGRYRWNGATWVPVTGLAPIGYSQYQQPPSVRVPTQWTRPLQYTIAAWYILSGVYALSLPFWLSSVMSQAINQSLQRQVSLNPNVSPPPADFVNSMTTMMTGVLWVGALFGIAICAVAVIGALQRWTWAFWAILVLMGLGALGLPINLASALSGSSSAFTYGMPAWISWVSVAVGIPGAAIFVWMIIALTRYGPWAMSRKTESPGVAPAPAT